LRANGAAKKDIDDFETMGAQFINLALVNREASDLMEAGKRIEQREVALRDAPKDALNKPQAIQVFKQCRDALNERIAWEEEAVRMDEKIARTVDSFYEAVARIAAGPLRDALSWLPGGVDGLLDDEQMKRLKAILPQRPQNN